MQEESDKHSYIRVTDLRVEIGNTHNKFAQADMDILENVSQVKQDLENEISQLKLRQSNLT